MNQVHLIIQFHPNHCPNGFAYIKFIHMLPSKMTLTWFASILEH